MAIEEGKAMEEIKTLVKEDEESISLSTNVLFGVQSIMMKNDEHINSDKLIKQKTGKRKKKVVENI